MLQTKQKNDSLLEEKKINISSCSCQDLNWSLSHKYYSIKSLNNKKNLSFDHKIEDQESFICVYQSLKQISFESHTINP